MKIIFSLALICLVGCGTIQSTSVTNVGSGSGQLLTASGAGYGYIHLYAPSIDDITTPLLAKLFKSCEGGNLANVQTTLSMREFLLLQGYMVDITATCLKK